MLRQIEFPPLPDNMVSLSWTSRPLCLLKGRNLWTSILFASIFKFVLSLILQLMLADQSISQRGKSRPSLIAGAVSHFPVKRLQRPVKEDYGAKHFVIFYVLIHPFKIYVWRSSLSVYGMLPPIWYGSHLCGMAIYTAKMSCFDPRWISDRHVNVHLPEALPTQMLKAIFDANPATHSAMVPRLAVPADVSGNLVYTSCWSIHRSHQVQQRLRNGVVNSRMRTNASFVSSLTNSATLKKN
jgi:hypothetical protein